MSLKQTCIRCKGVFSEELIDIADELYCLNCFGKSFAQCASCKEVGERKETEKWKGEDWCSTCLETQTNTCQKCENRFYNLDLYKNPDTDDLYCSDCFNEKFTNCDYCNHIMPSEYAFYWNQEYYCENCLCDRTFVCEDCGERYPDCDSNAGDDDRWYCPECIDAHSSDESEVPECKIPFSKTASKSFKLNKHRNFCGVEIECLNHDVYEQSFCYDELKEYGFSQVSDGSLDSETGVEFVSNPFNGDLLFEKIDEFCEELNKREYEVDKSCGLHIHISIPNRVKLLKRIFAFYQKYENFFFEMLPNSRKENTYCCFLGNSYHHTASPAVADCKTSFDFQKLFYKEKSIKKIREYKKDKYNRQRYSWLNFHSLFYRGTLEIRSHSGTIKADKIKNWLLIHLTALDYLKHTSFKTINELPDTRESFLSLFDKNLQNYILERWQKFSPEPLEVAC